MDNQPAPITLSVPMVPPGFCFKGNDQEKFNVYGSQFVSNSIINFAPGFGLVTPAQFQALEAKVQGLQDQIDALDPQVRSGTVPLAVGDSNVTVVFSSAMPDANYTINIEIVDDAGTGTSAIGWALVGDTKSTTGMTLRFYDIQAAESSFNYIVRNT